MRGDGGVGSIGLHAASDGACFNEERGLTIDMALLTELSGQANALLKRKQRRIDRGEPATWLAGKNDPARWAHSGLKQRLLLKPVACFLSPLHWRRNAQEGVLNALCMGVAGAWSSLSPLVALSFSSYSPLVLIPFSR